MGGQFAYDVFLSHSSRDKPMVRQIAEKLRQSGLRVWFDEWSVKPGQLIGKGVEEGLEQSRILVLAMSKAAFDSDWVTLEAQAAVFRDPANEGRRFIPVRLYEFEDSQIPRMLRGFKYVDVFRDGCEALLAACRVTVPIEAGPSPETDSSKEFQEGRSRGVVERMVRDRLWESFEIEEAISSDDDEFVFRARDKNLDRNVAIKVPLLPSHDANQFAEKFYRKMKSISVINHPNIIPVHAGFLIDHLPILVMWYVQGITLGTLIDRIGRLPLRRVRDLLIQVGDALSYSNQLGAIYHRVLPHNILYDRNEQLMLTPMNFARIDQPVSQRLSTNAPSEQMYYDSPEQLTRNENLDKSDQYSLGLIAYEMLTGNRYHNSIDQLELRQEIMAGPSQRWPEAFLDKKWRGSGLREIISRMLHRRPEERFESFVDLLASVRKITDEDLGLKSSGKSNESTQIRIVKDSLQRCRLQEGFFEKLHSQLLEKLSVSAIFKTRSEKVEKHQKPQWLLREGVDLLIEFLDEPIQPGDDRVPVILNRILCSHHNYNVSREHLDCFVESLVSTIQAFDTEVRRSKKSKTNIINAWHHVFSSRSRFLKRVDDYAEGR